MKSLEESMIIIFIFLCKSPTNVQYNNGSQYLWKKKQTNRTAATSVVNLYRRADVEL